MSILWGIPKIPKFTSDVPALSVRAHSFSRFRKGSSLLLARVAGLKSDNMNDIHKQHEIYMANASPSRWGPNATYIPPALIGGWALGVGGNANFSVRVGGNANFSAFRYQHVGIPNVKLWLWGSKPMRGPSVNGFALQWNIGSTLVVFISTRVQK